MTVVKTLAEDQDDQQIVHSIPEQYKTSFVRIKKYTKNPELLLDRNKAQKSIKFGLFVDNFKITVISTGPKDKRDVENRIKELLRQCESPASNGAHPVNGAAAVKAINDRIKQVACLMQLPLFGWTEGRSVGRSLFFNLVYIVNDPAIK